MNRKFHSIILIGFIMVALLSCGGTGGAPGSDPASTGIMITSTNLTVTSPDIDTVQDCCSPTPVMPAIFAQACTTLEKMITREDATLNVSTSNMTPDVTSAQFPASVQQCTITYIKANEDPAAPIIESLTIYPDCQLAVGANACPVTLIDITRKYQYSTPVFVTHTSSPAEQPTHYVAKYSCTYTNNFGKSGSFEAEIDLWLSDFNNC